MSDDLYARMGESDAAHWGGIQRWKDTQMRPIHPQVVSQRIRSTALAPLGKAVSIVRKVSGDEALARTVPSAAFDLVRLAVSASEVSVHRRCILKTCRSVGFDVRTLQDIRSLMLDDILTVEPRLSLAYSVTAAAKGVVSGTFASDGPVAAVPGTDVASASGASVTASAIATDIMSFLVAATRLVAHTAAYYGYDSENPTERPSSTMVLPQAINPTGSGRDLVVEKQTTMLVFNEVMCDLARRDSLDGLGSNVVVSAISSLFSAMGVRLVFRKLTQTVPAAGVVMSAGLSATLMRIIGETADHLHRERFFTKRYGHIEPGDGVSTDLVRSADTQELSADIACYVEIAETESRPQRSSSLAPAAP